MKIDPNKASYEDDKALARLQGLQHTATLPDGTEIWTPGGAAAALPKGFDSVQAAHDYALITPGVSLVPEFIGEGPRPWTAESGAWHDPTHEVFHTGNVNDPFNIREIGNTQGGTNVLSSPYYENDGSLWVFNRQTGEKKRLTDAPSSDKPTGEDIEFLKTEALDGGKGGFIDFFLVDGKVQSYTRSAAETVIQEGKDKFKAEGGTFYQTSPGRYDFVADPDKEFAPGPMITLPGIGKMVQTSPNQYQIIEDTVEPGVVRDPISGRRYIQQTDGNWGAEVKPVYDPELQRVDGMSLFQQRSGDVSQLTPPNMDDIITQALIDGEYDKAFAFQDFRDRPSAQETFQTALEFARSPADQVLISAIARGEQFVAPPPEGEIQRVGPQPDFLVQAYQDFQRRTQAGRAPTDEEATDLSARAAAGQSPLTDNLQTRLEELKIENQQFKNEAISLKTQQDQQVFQQNNKSLFGGEDESLTKLKNDLGLSSGTSMTEVTRESLKRIIAGLPDSQKEYAASQVDSIHNGELTVEQVIGNLAPRTDASRLNDYDLGITTTPDTAPTAPAVKETGTYEDNWAKSLAAYPDLTDKTFDLFGGVDLSQKTADEINVHAGAPAGQSFGASTVRSNIHQGETFSTEFGWETPEAIESREQASEQAAMETSFNKKMFDLGLNPDGTPIISGSESSSDVSAISASSLGSAGSFPTSLNTGSPAITSNTLAYTADTPSITNTTLGATGSNLSPGTTLGTATNMSDFESLIKSAQKSPDPFGGGRGRMFGRAGGGTVQPGEMTVVGENGPEIAMMPPGTHILPLGKATKQDIRAAQSTGRAYQTGGIVFGDLPIGLQQIQRGRPITPPRGYLSQAAGLNLPSAQAMSNITPESRDVFLDLAAQAGIPRKSFAQELASTIPSGRRMPVARIAPISRRGVQ